MQIFWSLLFAIFYSLQQAKTSSRVESMAGNWFNLEYYIALHKCERNKPKVFRELKVFKVINQGISWTRKEGNCRQEANKRHWATCLWNAWEETTRFGEWCLFKISLKKYKPNTYGSINSRSLPPCSCVTKKKSNEQITSTIWNNDTIANAPIFHPKNCGWILENGTFKIK